MKKAENAHEKGVWLLRLPQTGKGIYGLFILRQGDCKLLVSSIEETCALLLKHADLTSVFYIEFPVR